jgi:hypothetical protein
VLVEFRQHRLRVAQRVEAVDQVLELAAGVRSSDVLLYVVLYLEDFYYAV